MNNYLIFWKKNITEIINEDLIKSKSKYLFNLSSKEYFESINKKEIKSKVISFDFKKLKNNELLNIGMMIKNAEEVWQNF